jgi:hypothetical protein
MSRNDGTGEVLSISVEDVLGKLDCREETLFGEGLRDQVFNLLRLLVFPFGVRGGDQHSAFDLVGRTELAKFVEDGGVAKAETLSNAAQAANLQVISLF